jgi:hypothetical protein
MIKAYIQARRPATTPTRTFSHQPAPPAPTPVTQRKRNTSDATSAEQAPRLRCSLADIPVSSPERKNRTGLPASLRAGIERLSGISLNDVHVHYNSPKPGGVQALAYTQGTDIHLGPDQEQHLAHEAWHVVQQKQGRVSPTMQLSGMAINDDQALEREAESISSSVSDQGVSDHAAAAPGAQTTAPQEAGVGSPVIQRARKNKKKKTSKPKASTTKTKGGGVKKKTGGAKKATGGAKKKTSKATGGTKKKTGGASQTRTAYKIGQHGAKKREQQRLSAATGLNVTGDDFESEHTIGFEPLNQTSGNKRGKGAAARKLENEAPAYQERKAFHRANIGTGTKGTADASGFTSQTYRDTQRRLLEQGKVSAAVQLNQLTYAHQPGFQSTSNTPEAQAATDSFHTMVGAMDNVTYATSSDATATVTVDQLQKAEMLAGQKGATQGSWPTSTDIAEAYKEVEIDKYWE